MRNERGRGKRWINRDERSCEECDESMYKYLHPFSWKVIKTGSARFPFFSVSALLSNYSDVGRSRCYPRSCQCGFLSRNPRVFRFGFGGYLPCKIDVPSKKSAHNRRASLSKGLHGRENPSARSSPRRKTPSVPRRRNRRFDPWSAHEDRLGETWTSLDFRPGNRSPFRAGTGRAHRRGRRRDGRCGV